jgi:hypothetical protein
LDNGRAPILMSIIINPHPRHASIVTPKYCLCPTRRNLAPEKQGRMQSSRSRFSDREICGDEAFGSDLCPGSAEVG